MVDCNEFIAKKTSKEEYNTQRYTIDFHQFQ